MNLLDKIFKTSKTRQLANLTIITRTEIFEGLAISGIIRNMQYYFTDIQVYRDGLISCWEMVDLEMFKKKLNKNWLVTSIPDGQTISIFGLGHWIIEKGQWTYTKDSFYDYVYSLVKELNPTLENLHNYNGSNSKRVGKINVAKHFIPDTKPYYNDNPNTVFPKRISGEKFHIFFRENAKTYLATLSICKNGHLEITNIPNKKTFKFENIKELINSGRLTSEPKTGELITIVGLGSFLIKSGEGLDISLKYDEFLDKYNELNGTENSIEKCRRIFEEYKQNPTLRLKQELKEVYESVPKHQRDFVGTMDTKDYQVRQVIYGNKIKKEFEEIYGYEYPYEDMPIPNEE